MQPSEPFQMAIEKLTADVQLLISMVDLLQTCVEPSVKIARITPSDMELVGDEEPVGNLKCHQDEDNCPKDSQPKGSEHVHRDAPRSRNRAIHRVSTFPHQHQSNEWVQGLPAPPVRNIHSDSNSLDQNLGPEWVLGRPASPVALEARQHDGTSRPTASPPLPLLPLENGDDDEDPSSHFKVIGCDSPVQDQDLVVCFGRDEFQLDL
jgi:hypothetical protein